MGGGGHHDRSDRYRTKHRRTVALLEALSAQYSADRSRLSVHPVRYRQVVWLPRPHHAGRRHRSRRLPCLVRQHPRDLRRSPPLSGVLYPARRLSVVGRNGGGLLQGARTPGLLAGAESGTPCHTLLLSLPLSLRRRRGTLEPGRVQRSSPIESPDFLTSPGTAGMVYLLALGSALFYGAADFTGGLTSRRAGALPVVVLSHFNRMA